MPAKRVDWMDLAHEIAKERERIQDSLPTGVGCHLSICAYGYSGASYSVSLTHEESQTHGYGSGCTPAKALEDAKANLKEKYEKWQRRPRLVGVVKALGPVQQDRALFEA